MVARAVSIAAGQTITLSTILDDLPHVLPGLSSAAVIAAGATGLPAVAPSLIALNSLRSIWNTAISRAMIFSLAMACMALPFTLGMEWLNAKRATTTSEDVANRPSLVDTGDQLEMT